MSIMKKISQKTIISVALLSLFFLALIVLEQVISPTDRMSMLLTVLKKGAIYALVVVSTLLH